MLNIVIADTSVLIVLSKINRLHILRDIFNSITITPEIHLEFGEELPDWIIIKEINDEKRKRILMLELDKGEASAIALGLENDDSLLLIDERKGRKIASDLGLKIMGTLGVIIKAKELKIIKSLADEFEKLRKVDFWISEKITKNIINKYE